MCGKSHPRADTGVRHRIDPRQTHLLHCVGLVSACGHVSLTPRDKSRKLLGTNVTTRKGGGPRVGTRSLSMHYIRARVTPEEHAEFDALAAYLQLSLSDLIRRLLVAERARLVASGKRPPRR